MAIKTADSGPSLVDLRYLLRLIEVPQRLMLALYSLIHLNITQIFVPKFLFT